MKDFILRVLLFIGSILVSSIINEYYIDHLLNIFQIMSFFALMANRVALALFIYFFIDMTFISRRYKLTEIINKLFLIYFIWLVGLLFGRFPKKDSHIKDYFNFHSFIPKWIHHLDNSLVDYYLFGNIFVFIPFGLFLRYHKNLFFSTAYFVLTICLFETLQAVTHLGFFDIDDLILNGIGGLFGILVMDLYKTFFK